MGWGFRKSIRIAPGVRINLSSRGVSTTLGGRGASVNISRKGARTTVGITGTGISCSALAGRAGQAGRGGGGGEGTGGANTGAAQPGGCLGAGCVGFFLLVLIGMCAGPGDPPTTPATVTPSTLYGTHETTAPAPSEDRDWFHIHGTLNVRAEPDKDAAIVRTLRRWDYVRLGPKDANGWARLYNSMGSAEGYVYRASELVRADAPATQSTAESGSRGSSSSGGGASSRRSSAANRGYYTGPRGGCYTYSASGRKRYVDRSYCN